jgi:ribosomal protein S18 acetylase RimI-like enzyme
VRIEPVEGGDLDDLLPLMRAYCDFYEVSPTDDDLLALSRGLIANPDHEGIQLIARGPSEEALGFATLIWSWQTLDPGRAAVMNDLYVVPEVRRGGVGGALIEECRRHSRDHGAKRLLWETARDNSTAQALYRGLGAEEESWITFSLTTND